MLRVGEIFFVLVSQFITIAPVDASCRASCYPHVERQTKIQNGWKKFANEFILDRRRPVFQCFIAPVVLCFSGTVPGKNMSTDTRQ